MLLYLVLSIVGVSIVNALPNLVGRVSLSATAVFAVPDAMVFSVLSIPFVMISNVVSNVWGRLAIFPLAFAVLCVGLGGAVPNFNVWQSVVLTTQRAFGVFLVERGIVTPIGWTFYLTDFIVTLLVMYAASRFAWRRAERATSGPADDSTPSR